MRYSRTWARARGACEGGACKEDACEGRTPGRVRGGLSGAREGVRTARTRTGARAVTRRNIAQSERVDVPGGRRENGEAGGHALARHVTPPQLWSE
eukprot:7375918-Prymnesium_polylepis.2